MTGSRAKRRADGESLSTDFPTLRFERREMKLLVAPGARDTLIAELAGRLRADPHGDALGRYRTTSLYYDTPALDGYWRRLQRVPLRRKLRVRTYESAEGGAYVEIKQREGNRIGKSRLRLPLGDALALCALEPVSVSSPADMHVAEDVRRIVADQGLRPTCVLRYHRHAFGGGPDEGDLRVTLDSELDYRFRDLVPEARGGSWDGRLPDDLCVMEIKVASTVPYWLSLLAGRHALLQGVSKYGLAVEAGPLAQALAARRAAR